MYENVDAKFVSEFELETDDLKNGNVVKWCPVLYLFDYFVIDENFSPDRWKNALHRLKFQNDYQISCGNFYVCMNLKFFWVMY